jgi:hypothetical protein
MCECHGSYSDELKYYSHLAQLVEQQPVKLPVIGSNPMVGVLLNRDQLLYQSLVKQLQ